MNSNLTQKVGIFVRHAVLLSIALLSTVIIAVPTGNSGDQLNSYETVLEQPNNLIQLAGDKNLDDLLLGGEKPTTESDNEYWASAKEITLDGKHGCLSYDGLTTIARTFMSFRPGASVDQMVTDIVAFSGLQKNFIVRRVAGGNAAADTQGTTRLILYNPEWLNELNRRTGTSWAAYSVMAHEIGHHLQGHTLVPGGSRPPSELEADEFSGFTLYQMGAELEDAQKAMATFGDPNGSDTHPPRDQRLVAIEKGWDSAKKLRPRSGGVAKPNEVPDLEPIPAPQKDLRPIRTPQMPSPFPPQVAASACWTQFGICPMVVAIPPGAPCYCQTMMGLVPGVAR